MLFTLKLFLLQLKAYIKSLPGIIISAVVFVCLIASIYYGASTLLSSSEDIERATVAVVTNGIDDEYISLALTFLESMRSTKMAFEFKEMQSRAAYSGLNDGSIIAVIDFPDNAINSILTGENKPVRITFNDSNPLSNVFLTEITSAGASFLGAAQAGTYTTADIYRNLDIQGSLGKAYDDVDWIGYNFVLKRQGLFEDTADENDFGSTIIFYLASGIIILSLLVGVTFLRIAAPDEPVFLMHGCQSKFFSLRYIIAKFLALYMVYLGLSFAIFKAIGPIFENLDMKYRPHISGIYIFALFITAFVFMTAYIMPRLQDSIILLFILSIAFEIISGLIIPAAFLPSKLVDSLMFMPFTALHNHVLYILGAGATENYNYLFIYIFTFIVLTLIGMKLRIKALLS